MADVPEDRAAVYQEHVRRNERFEQERARANRLYEHLGRTLRSVARALTVCLDLSDQLDTVQLDCESRLVALDEAMSDLADGRRTLESVHEEFAEALQTMRRCAMQIEKVDYGVGTAMRHSVLRYNNAVVDGARIHGTPVVRKYMLLVEAAAELVTLHREKPLRVRGSALQLLNRLSGSLLALHRAGFERPRDRVIPKPIAMRTLKRGERVVTEDDPGAAAPPDRS